MTAQHYCALITLGEDGRPVVRTMNPFPPDDDMMVWYRNDQQDLTSWDREECAQEKLRARDSTQKLTLEEEAKNRE